MQTKQIKTTNKTAMAVAIATALGAVGIVDDAQATIYKFDTVGLFTMLTSTGAPLQNTSNPYYNDPTWKYGLRTQITGTMTYDDTSGTGSMTVAPFAFYNGGDAVAAGITFTSVGNGSGGTGPLVLGNMLFNWNGNNGIPVSIVWDATGFQSAVTGSPSCGQVIAGSGAIPASNGISKNTLPIGAGPFVTTTWNTTTNGAAVLGNANSGTLPLWDNEMVGSPTPVAVSIGGSPMITAPFAGFNANFDFTSLTVSQDAAGACTLPPHVATVSPTTTGVLETLPIVATFDQAVTVSTVSNTTFTVVRTSDSAPVAGTIAPSNGNKTYTFTPTADLEYNTQYTATLTTGIQAVSPNILYLPSPKIWSFTTRKQPVATPPCQSGGPMPLGSNFTMLDKAGIAFGGTNDVEYSITLPHNTSVNSNNFNMTMKSAADYPFLSAPWHAHHIRTFSGPATYQFDTTCTVSDLVNGISDCMHPLQTLPSVQTQRYLTMTLGSGQVGAHMLFDWNGNENIDVVVVWNQNAQWQDPDPLSLKNNLWNGDLWAGPAGYGVNHLATWAYVSTDSDGDGIIGEAMVDGAFIGYSANFNLSATDSCTAQPNPVTTARDTQLGGGGCSLSATPVNPLERGDWWLIAGFIAWMGVVVKRKRA